MAENHSFSNFSTDSIHTGQDTCDKMYQCYSAVPPIYLSTIYKYPNAGEKLGYIYSRDLNPNRAALEAALAKLEGGKYCNAFSSGSAATSSLGFLLRAGDHVICTVDAYAGTTYFWRNIASRFNIEVTLVDCSNLEDLDKAFKKNTKMLYVETPTNPCLRVTDLEGAVALARKYQDILIVVDNTFASPYFQRPLSYGVDLVLHSVSKYLNGHSDVIMGAIISNQKEIYDKLLSIQMDVGSIPSPFDCYIASRSLKTLSVRMERHQKNALAVANYLEQSPHAIDVKYLGLPSHPQHELAKKQMIGFSGMISFSVNGTVEQAKKFLKSLKVILLTLSLGGVESVAELTPLMTREDSVQTELDELGISPTFILFKYLAYIDQQLYDSDVVVLQQILNLVTDQIRLSVGIEDTADLIEDIEQAFREAMA